MSVICLSVAQKFILLNIVSPKVMIYVNVQQSIVSWLPKNGKQGPRKWAYLRCFFSSWLYPWTTILALFRMTVSNSSNLFMNTHLVPIIDLSLGRGTRYQTLFLLNCCSSSYIAVTQSESARVSCTLFGSMLDRKAQKAQKILSLDLVCTSVLMSDIIWSRGCELWCF